MPSAFPTGTILIWTGSTAPTGYTLCNGTNGAPNLVGKIIIGAGSSYAVGAQGGSTTSGTAWTGTISGTPSIAATTLALAQISSHSHAGWRNSLISGLNGGSLLPVYTAAMGAGASAVATRDSSLTSIGGGGSHTHTLTGAALGSTTATSAISIMPPYSALTYIMVTDGVPSHSLVPSGVIVPWSGAQSAIPAGWSLVTALSDRFLYGSNASLKTSGGAIIPAVTGTVAATNVSTATVSIGTTHSHGHYGTVSGGTYKLPAGTSSGGTPLVVNSGTSTEGGTGQHTHAISGINSISVRFQNTLPTYYALCYIQKN